MVQCRVFVSEPLPLRRAGISFRKTQSGFILSELDFRLAGLRFPTPHIAFGVPPITLSVDTARKVSDQFVGGPVVRPYPVVENVGRTFKARCEFGLFLGNVESVYAVEIDEPVTPAGQKRVPFVMIVDLRLGHGGLDQDDPGADRLQGQSAQDLVSFAGGVDWCVKLP